MGLDGGQRLRPVRVPAREACGSGRGQRSTTRGPEGGEHAGERVSSPLSPWGAVFALWGRDELSDGEIQALSGAETRMDRAGEGEEADMGSDPVIHAIMSFDYGAPSVEETRRFVESKLLCHKRFCKRLMLPGTRWGHPRWAPVEVDVAQHVWAAEIEAPQPGTDLLARGTALHRHVEGCLGRPLPLDRPPWEVQVLSYPESSGNPGGVMLWRIHHAIGDGISLASLLLSLADGGPPPLPSAPPPPPARSGNLWELFLAACATAWNTLLALVYAARLFVVADMPSAVRADAGRYRKKCGRAVAISQEVSVAELKAVGRAVGATLNDVLMAAMAEALASYEVLQGTHEDRCKRLTFVMAVNTRPIKGIQAEIAASARGEDTHWGNRVGMILGGLPLFERDGMAIGARERLRRVHEMLSSMKRSLGPVVLTAVLQFIQRWAGLGPGYMVVDHLMYNASTLLSNVPGPQAPVFLLGRQVTGICNVVNGTPQGTSFSFLSYDGGLRLALTASRSVIADPGELTRLFEEALRRIGDAVGVTFGKGRVAHPKRS